MALKLKPFTEVDLNVDPKDVKLGKELGRGNFSRVFQGTFRDRPVAIKQQDLVDVELERYLMNELAVLRKVENPGCIKFYGAYKAAKSMNIITEYVEGGDLRRLLGDKSTPLGFKLRTKIAAGCAKAIAHLHKLEIIHRDIKTDNVLLTADCVPKLCDFGFARQWDKSKTMTMCGTDEFMAPEIMFGIQYDEKVDVYSFGITLAEIITRKPPGKLEGFLDRKPGDGFNVDFAELESECNKVKAPNSMVLLTKECVANEPHDRLDANGAAEWLEDLYKELPDDKESMPNLHGDAISDKLQQYINKQESDGGEGGDKDDDDDDGPKSAQEAQAVKQAVQARADLLDKAHQLETQKSVKHGHKAYTGSKEDASVAFKDDKAPVDSKAARPASKSVSGGGGLFSLCFGGSRTRSKSTAGARVLEMQGWVTKRGGRIKTWKRRYMVITSLGIVYFKGPEDADGSGEAQGQIEWSEMAAVAGVVCNAVPSVMTGKANSFAVHTVGRTYFMVADNIDERGRWIRAISDGHRAWSEKQNKPRKPDVRMSRNVGVSG